MAADRETLPAWMTAFDPACPFGPLFFVSRLARFVRDRCPDPREPLPAVELHLGSGETLDLCHVVALAPGWAALAVHDRAREGGAPTGRPAMRTEIVPYGLVVRVTIRGLLPEAGHHIGFDAGHDAVVLDGDDAGREAEAALRAAGAPAAMTKSR